MKTLPDPQRPALLKSCRYLRLILLFFISSFSLSAVAQYTVTSCYDTKVTLTGTGPGPYVWYGASTLAPPIGNGYTFETDRLKLVTTFHYEDVNGVKKKVIVYPSTTADPTFTLNFAACVGQNMPYSGAFDKYHFAFKGNGVNYGAELPFNYPTQTDANLTMEASVYWKGGTTDQCILYNGNATSNGYGIFLTSSGDIYVALGAVKLTSSAKVTKDKWQHVAAVRKEGSPSVWTLYLDGTPFTLSNSAAKPLVPSSGGFYVGRTNETLGKYFNGKIDEVKIWTVAHDLYEIGDNRSSIVAAPQNDLAGYWKFDEEVGTEISDASGHGNTLTLSDNGAHDFSSKYEWNFDGATEISSPYTFHNFTTGGNKSISFSITDLIGCKSTEDTIINANSYKFPVTATASVTTACIDEKISLKASGGGVTVSSAFDENLSSDWKINGFRLERDNGFFNTPDYSNVYVCLSNARLVENAYLQAPVFSTVGLTDLKIKLINWMPPSHEYKGVAEVQLSVGNDQSWVTIKKFEREHGLPFEFAVDEIPVPTAYEGKPVVYLRLLYNDPAGIYSGWYIDKLEMYTGTGVPMFHWTSVPNYFTSDEQNPINVVHKGNTTYSVTANTGCASDPATVTVITCIPPPGNALSFDVPAANQTANQATVNNNTLGNFGMNDFTIETHLRSSDISRTGSIINKRDVCNAASYFDLILEGSFIKLIVAAQSVTTASLTGDIPVADGRWHHIAAVREGNRLSVYVDGELDIFLEPLAKHDISNNAPVRMGNNVCTNIFKGVIDELRIWNVARTQPQLKENMTKVVNLASANLQAYYQFDQGNPGDPPSTILADKTNNNNTATLTNFLLSGNSNWVPSFAMIIPKPLPATAINATGFTANWAAPDVTVSGQINYYLEVAVAPIFGAPLTFTVSGTSKEVTGIGSGFPYYYRVRATHASFPGQGATSAVMTLTTVSNDSRLSALALSSGPISPAFNLNQLDYTASAGSSSVAVTPTVLIAFSTVQVRVNSGTYTAVQNGTASVPLALNVGSNLVEVKVTPQDGVSERIYRITVTRKLSPIVTSINPVKGPVGSSVTITGEGFNAVSGLNIVFFGATKATVNSGSATTLTVTVPSGATYSPVSVINTGNALMAQSPQFFTPTFIPSLNSISVTDFEAKKNFAAGFFPTGVLINDLDGDQKPDLIVLNATGNTFSVFRNSGTTGAFTDASFTNVGDFQTRNGTNFIKVEDLNGDGRPDVVVQGNANTPGNSGVSILKNISTSGNIQFASKADITVADAAGLAIGDMNGDGKPELCISKGNGVVVLNNTSDVSNISFGAETFLSLDQPALSMGIADLDGDGKLDLVTANFADNSVSILRNTGTGGILAFAAKQDLDTGINPFGLALGDLDDDGKPEISVAVRGADRLKVFHNEGSTGVTNFSSSIDLVTGFLPTAAGIGDMDGDGRPDLVVTNRGTNTVSVFRNLGSFSFAGKVDLPVGADTQPYGLAIGDLNSDGRPDVVSSNISGNTISLFRNKPGYSTNSNLSSLIVGTNTLNPVFTPATTSYKTTIPYSVLEVTVTPTVADGNAIQHFSLNNGPFVPLSSGSTSQGLPMMPGTNTIRIRVTAQDIEVTKVYTITVIRLANPPGNALSFAGAPDNDHVFLDNHLTSAAFTIEGYIRTETPSATGTYAYDGTVLFGSDISGNANDFTLSILNDKLAFFDGNTNQNTLGSASIVDGKWHHIAMVRKIGTGVLLYLDGVVDGANNAPFANQPLNANNKIKMGGNFTGSMDEVRIWNLARTEQELDDGMLKEIDPSHTGLIAYYSFDAGNAFGPNTSEVTLYDKTANGYDGVLNNFILHGPVGNWIESYAMVVPTKLIAPNVGGHEFVASWTAPAVGSVEKYIVDVSKSPGFETYNTYESPGTSRSIDNLDPSTNYLFRVRAEKSSVTNQSRFTDIFQVRTLSTNANLTQLGISPGTLSPAFDPATMDYSVVLAAGVTVVTLNTIPEDPNAKISIGTNTVPLSEITGTLNQVLVGTGNNTIQIRILSEDESEMKIYSILITRPLPPPGNALSFDGIDDNITIDNNSLGNFRQNPFTIEMYVRTTQATGAGSVLNKRNICGLTSYVDMIIAEGKLKFVSCSNASGLNYNSLVGTTSVADGKWHHIAVTRNGTLISLYVDGNLDLAFTATGVADIDNSLNPDPIKIGNSVCNNIFKGSMDELRIWDVAKTQAQLQSARFSPLSLPATNLLAYYNFDIRLNETNPAFTDLSGSEKHGTLHNFDPVTSRVESYAMVVPVPASASLVSSTEFTANWLASVTGNSERYFLDVSTSETFAAGNFIPGYNALEVNTTSKKVTLPPSGSGRQMAGTTYYYRVSADKTSVSGQGANSSTVTVTFNALPVNLVSFTGKRIEFTNLLEWKITDEKQFDRYEVESSLDAKNFARIGIVKAMSNETSGITNYEYPDKTFQIANLQTIYYRLKMIDLDGSFALSRIVAIENTISESAIGEVYPSPASGKNAFIDIRVSEATVWKIQTFNTMGITLKSRTIKLQKGLNKISVDLNNLSPGIYMMKLVNDVHQHEIRKVVVE